MEDIKSGDAEDNASTQEKNIFDGKKYEWFKLDELPNIPFNYDGLAYPKNKGILYNGFGFITPTYDTSDELDELRAEISDHINLEALLESTKNVNEMFANLGEAYRACSDRSLVAWGEVTKRHRIADGWSASVNILDKSLAHLMFNT
jgi:hypothetical protein